METAAKAVSVAMIAVVVVLLLLWTFQRNLIYFPDTSAVPPASEVIPEALDVTLKTADGLSLGAWFAPPSRAADTGMAVLVAPGNAGNREGRSEFAELLSANGFAVLLMDYRGYGGNPGRPSEAGLALDADAAVAALTELGYPPDRTIYFGESLGTGVVSALQERQPPAGVVLRSPFTQLADVGSYHYPWLPVRALLRNRFPVLDLMSRSEVPATVIYGDADSVVPPELSRRVADGAASLNEVVVLPGANHNDPVMFGDQVVEAVTQLASAR